MAKRLHWCEQPPEMQLQMLITSQLYHFLLMIPNAMKDAEWGWNIVMSKSKLTSCWLIFLAVCFILCIMHLNILIDFCWNLHKLSDLLWGTQTTSICFVNFWQSKLSNSDACQNEYVKKTVYSAMNVFTWANKKLRREMTHLVPSMAFLWQTTAATTPLFQI